MTILIVDNGSDYSDHSIDFVEVPTRLYNKHADAIDGVLERGSSGSDPKVIARADRIEWRAQGGTTPWTRAIYAHILDAESHRDFLRSLPVEVLRVLVAEVEGVGREGLRAVLEEVEASQP